MLYSVILKCEVKKKKERHLMLYFVILKCEVQKRKRETPHAVLCDTEV